MFAGPFKSACAGSRCRKQSKGPVSFFFFTFKLQLFICVHVCKGWGLMPRCTCGSQRATVGVSLLFLLCGLWASNSAHQTWCQAPLPIKPPLQHPPVGFYLQSVFVFILVPYGLIAPQDKKTCFSPFPLCPCLCHFSSLLPKLVTRQLFFSAVGPWAGSQQPRPVLEGEKNGQRLVLVVELNEGWKLLC